MFHIKRRSLRRTGLTLLLGAAMAAALVGRAGAAGSEEQAMLERLKKLYPSSEFSAVSKTPLPGMFEVTMGSQVAYVGKDGRYVVFGRLVDLQNPADPGATRPVAATLRVDVAELPLRDAIVQVNGSGERKLFVFLDPKCPGCDRFDADLSRLPDTTVYTFLAPALDPDSREAARRQWIVFMPARALETQVIDQNLQLARRLGLTGTPALIRADGEVASGVMPLPLLSAWLDAGTKVARAATQP